MIHDSSSLFLVSGGVENFITQYPGDLPGCSGLMNFLSCHNPLADAEHTWSSYQAYCQLIDGRLGSPQI